MAAPTPLPGLLRCSWRGVPFFMEQSERVSGRRRAEFPLAASDRTLTQDLGLLTGPIDVEGIYVGADYIAVERAMRAALSRPGPGVLEHPWYGPLLVEIADTGTTAFDHRRLRSFKIRASFKPAENPITNLLSTLGAMFAAATGLSAAAQAVTSAAMTLAYAGDAFRSVATAVEAAMLAGPGGTALAALSTLPGASAIGAGADAAVAWQADWTARIAKAGTPSPAPAIGAGPAGRTSTSVISPRTAAAALVVVADASTSRASDPLPRRLSALGLRSAALAAAVEPLAADDYESAQDAAARRTEILAAFDRAMTEAAALVSDAPSVVAPVHAALRTARRRIAEDLDDRIGRLPSVVTIAPPTVVSAWLVAQHVAGGAPGRIVATFEDIVSRNRLRHPAAAGGAPIEVLP